jgi:actin-like ATPase involved in cell morphogenesis
MCKIFFKKTPAIELGAERMLVVENDKIALNEPTVIAVDNSQKRTRYAVGNAALELEGQRILRTEFSAVLGANITLKKPAYCDYLIR